VEEKQFVYSEDMLHEVFICIKQGRLY